jgi:hypothetical protein
VSVELAAFRWRQTVKDLAARAIEDDGEGARPTRENNRFGQGRVTRPRVAACGQRHTEGRCTIRVETVEREAAIRVPRRGEKGRASDSSPAETRRGTYGEQ